MIVRMISNVRLLLSLSVFFTSWALMIGSTIYLGRYIRELFDLWVGPLWNDGIQASASVAPDGIHPILSNLLITPSTDSFFNHVLSSSITMGGVVLSIHILLIWVRPIKKDVLDVARGMPIKRISLDSEIGAMVSEMSEKAGVATPHVYIVDSDDINAFAIGKPFRNAVVLTSGVMSLPEGYMLWILGHEMGHLARGDSTPSMLWLAANRTSIWFYNTRVRIIRILHPVLVRLPLIRLLVFPTELILIGLFRSTSFVDYIAMRLFTIIDRAMLRSVEYRADAFAANLVGAQFGVEVVEMLGYAERKPTLMDTHPPAFRRAKRLRDLAESNQ